MSLNYYSIIKELRDAKVHLEEEEECRFLTIVLIKIHWKDIFRLQIIIFKFLEIIRTIVFLMIKIIFIKKKMILIKNIDLLCLININKNMLNKIAELWAIMMCKCSLINMIPESFYSLIGRKFRSCKKTKKNL